MADSNTISNKTVVVTGGSRGIGLEWVRTLLEQGNTVVATGRDPDASPGLKELAQQYGDKLILTKLEAASEESITAWAEGLKGTVSHIDVFINNAGICVETFSQAIADISTKTLAETFSVNVYGPILVTQQLLKQGLLGGEQPSLVAYTSSILASMGGFAFPTANVYAYRASKAALNMLVVTSAQELASRNITSVTLHPGYVATDMTSGQSGTISVGESITGQLKVLQDGRLLNGKFYSYTGDELLF